MSFFGFRVGNWNPTGSNYLLQNHKKRLITDNKRLQQRLDHLCVILINREHKQSTINTAFQQAKQYTQIELPINERQRNQDHIPLPTRHVVDNNPQRQLSSPPVNEHQGNEDHTPPGQLGIVNLQPFYGSLLTTSNQILETNLEIL